MAWRSLPGRRGSRWLGRFSMLPKVLSGHPETPDTSFSDAAQSDAGRGAASRALCLLPSQMRAGAQRAMPCVCCLVRCGQGCSQPCPVSAARSDAGRDTASRALCLLPGQMQAGTETERKPEVPASPRGEALFHCAIPSGVPRGPAQSLSLLPTWFGSLNS